MIESFSGDYRWLSNFYPCTVFYEEDQYPSVENAYQAAKVHKEDRQAFFNCTPGESKRLSEGLFRKYEWELRRLEVMEDLLVQKFSVPEFKVLLLSTGDELLIEGNHWNDTFWGVCKGTGQNNLGKLLMKIRGRYAKAI